MSAAIHVRRYAATEFRKGCNAVRSLVLCLCTLSALPTTAEQQHVARTVMDHLTRLAEDSRNPVDQSQPGWIIIDVPADYTRYFFTSDSHDPAHPAMFERSVFERDGQIHMGTRVICEGKRSACDRYLEEFREQDRQLQERYQRAEP